MRTPAEKQAARAAAIERARRDVEEERGHSNGEAALEFIADHSTDPVAAELARRTFERREEE
jgi:hypothetical protein